MKFSNAGRTKDDDIVGSLMLNMKGITSKCQKEYIHVDLER